MKTLIELLSREAFIIEEKLDCNGENFYISVYPPDKENDGYVLLRRGMMVRVDTPTFEGCLTSGDKTGGCSIFIDPPFVYTRRNFVKIESVNEDFVNQLVKGLYHFWDVYFEMYWDSFFESCQSDDTDDA